MLIFNNNLGVKRMLHKQLIYAFYLQTTGNPLNIHVPLLKEKEKKNVYLINQKTLSETRKITITAIVSSHLFW